MNLIIGGDFNVPNIKWDLGEIKENPQYGYESNHAMLDTVNELFLTQMVDEPTRGANTLDQIFTTYPDQMTNIRTSPGMSGHDTVQGTFVGKLKLNQKTQRKIYMYDKASKDIIIQELTQLKEHILRGPVQNDANENWLLFRVSE